MTNRGEEIRKSLIWLKADKLNTAKVYLQYKSARIVQPIECIIHCIIHLDCKFRLLPFEVELQATRKGY